MLSTNFIWVPKNLPYFSGKGATSETFRICGLDLPKRVLHIVDGRKSSGQEVCLRGPMTRPDEGHVRSCNGIWGVHEWRKHWPGSVILLFRERRERSPVPSSAVTCYPLYVPGFRRTVLAESIIQFAHSSNVVSREAAFADMQTWAKKCLTLGIIQGRRLSNWNAFSSEAIGAGDAVAVFRCGITTSATVPLETILGLSVSEQNFDVRIEIRPTLTEPRRVLLNQPGIFFHVGLMVDISSPEN